MGQHLAEQRRSIVALSLFFLRHYLVAERRLGAGRLSWLWGVASVEVLESVRIVAGSR